MFIFVYNGLLNGQIKDKEIHLCKAKLVSRGNAFFELCLMVPANRVGYMHGMSAIQLKKPEEISTVLLFPFFAFIM